MRVITPGAAEAVAPTIVVELGAQGACLDPETDMRRLSAAGLARVAISSDLVAANPGGEGFVIDVAGWGKFNGGGPAPQRYEQTEAAAAHVARMHNLADRGIRHNWEFLTGPDEGDQAPVSKRFAHSTVSEAGVIFATLRSMTEARWRREGEAAYVIGSRKHLARLGDILDATDDPLAETLVGVVSETESEGIGADMTRLLYRALVLRGAKKSQSMDKLVRREDATVGRIVKVKEALTGMFKRHRRGVDGAESMQNA